MVDNIREYYMAPLSPKKLFTSNTIELLSSLTFIFIIQLRDTTISVLSPVDALVNANTACFPFVRYFMQGCGQDWSENEAENWLNKIS